MTTTDHTDFNNDSTYISLRGKLGDHIKEFHRIWAVYGYKPEKIAQRKRTIEKFFDGLFSDMIGEERKRLTEKRQELDNIIVEAHRLVKELELSTRDDPTNSIRDAATLMEEELMLYEIISDLRKRKEVRMERYNVINKNVEELCVVLGEEPFLLEFDGIPTDAQVDELNRHLMTLRQEESSRLDKYKKLVAKIKQHFVSLEKFPSNYLERIIITGQPSATPAPLSVSVVKEITDLESTLSAQVQRNRQDAESLWQKIRDLWKRLKTDEDIVAAFEATHQWTTAESQVNKRKSKAVVLIAKPTLITGLQSELARLEEEKKQNIASFIQELRDELEQLWDQCLTAEGEQYSRSAYMGIGFTESDFTSDAYSEELLEKHEKEVEKWRLYAEQEKKLIDGVNRRREMWTKWLGLEFRSDDPARLSNRGGALLREEKERKTLGKQIPKLEKELKKLSIDHGAKYGVKFMAHGEEISSQIDNEWNDFQEEKEARKNARKKPGVEDGKSMMMTSVAGVPGSRKRQAPQTPSSVVSKPGQTPKRGRMVLSTPKSPYCPRVPSNIPTRTQSLKIYPIGPVSSGQATTSNFKKVPVAISKKPPSGRNYPGVAVVQKYRKSIGRSRFANKRGSFSGSDKTSCNSISSADRTDGSFCPNLKLMSGDQFDFSKSADKPFGSDSGQGSSSTNLDGTTKDFRTLEKNPSANPERFLTPNPRAGSKTANSTISVSGKKRKSLRMQNREQIVAKPTPGKEDIVSPSSTYSEFSKEVRQSGLNSSVTAAALLAASREPLSNLGGSTTPKTPIRNRLAQPKMTPAKSTVPYNNRF